MQKNEISKVNIQIKIMFRNYEEYNDEDSNKYNHKNLSLYSLKNNQLEEENNLNKIAQEFKKIHSIIVNNNNININFYN